MWKEFKEFALKGNMLDLAVGMIIGAAFTGLVSSLVENIFTPLISLITGSVDFSGMKFDLVNPVSGETYGAITYGAFLTQLIDFIIMAFVVFLIVKGINSMRKKFEKPAEEEAPTEKECPYCKSMIPITATKCAHCTSVVEE